MMVFENIAELAPVQGPVALAIGFFDGLHIGHRAVVAGATDFARKKSGQAWALTFDTHPRGTVASASPPLLTSTDHKLLLLDRAGIDGCIVLSFTPAFAELSPADFVKELCGNVPALQEIAVGVDWRFGKGREGNTSLLAKLASGYDVRVNTVEPVQWKGSPVSSTRIRESVTRGLLDDAQAMLGRPFSVLGTVVKGRSLGRRLGFPTANIDSCDQVVPPHGVYAVVAAASGKEYDGVLNIGTRPTFASDQQPAKPTLELHLPGESIDLYGQEVEVLFAEHLRDEQAFPAATDLAEQIAVDIESATDALALFRKKSD